MKILRELLTSSKTKSLSSMRLIVLLGSFAIIICIVFMVFSGDKRLVDTLPYFIGGLVTFTTGKAIQSKFEDTPPL